MNNKNFRAEFNATYIVDTLDGHHPSPLHCCPRSTRGKGFYSEIKNGISHKEKLRCFSVTSSLHGNMGPYHVTAPLVTTNYYFGEIAAIDDILALRGEKKKEVKKSMFFSTDDLKTLRKKGITHLYKPDFGPQEWEPANVGTVIIDRATSTPILWVPSPLLDSDKAFSKDPEIRAKTRRAFARRGTGITNPAILAKLKM